MRGAADGFAFGGAWGLSEDFLVPSCGQAWRAWQTPVSPNHTSFQPAVLRLATARACIYFPCPLRAATWPAAAGIAGELRCRHQG